MPTNKPRINIPFEEETAGLLAQIAEQEDRSVASLVRELVLEALEMREDLYLSELAEQRDKKGVKIYSHKDAWKKNISLPTKKM